MSFELLRKHESSCKDKILNICTNYKLHFELIKNLATEISSQTMLSYEESLYLIEYKLKLGYSYEDIIREI